MKTLYFDCFCGAAGDMLVGALLDAGASFDALRAGLDSLDVPGYTVRADKVVKQGITATHFVVDVDPDQPKPHRHLHHVLDIIGGGDLPEVVKRAATQTFDRIAECEAQVHGTTKEKIHFHEVGAIDSIVDIVGVHLGLYLLGIERVEASPLPVGFGTVKAAHGVMPVPAPATVALLEGVPTYGGDVEGELVTPTGAALVAQLAQRFGSMPMMEVSTVGYGSGTRDVPGRANVVRALVGETADAVQASESIVVVEANIDDMEPELLPPLLEEAIAKGARDAFLTPILGKKGRAGHILTILCDEARVSDLTALLFLGSSTLGLRMRREQRICLEREWKTVRTDWGNIRIKIGYFEGEPTAPAPEFEECRELAAEAGVPVLTIYNAALAAAVKGEYDHA